MSYKKARLAEDVHRELTDIFRTLKDPRISGLISIVKVELSNDQSSCKVYVSSLEGLEATKEALKGLKSAAGYIRREIGARLDMRRSPEIRFIADDSIAYSARLEEKLKEISTDGN